MDQTARDRESYAASVRESRLGIPTIGPYAVFDGDFNLLAQFQEASWQLNARGKSPARLIDEPSYYEAFCRIPLLEGTPFCLFWLNPA